MPELSFWLKELLTFLAPRQCKPQTVQCFDSYLWLHRRFPRIYVAKQLFFFYFRELLTQEAFKLPQKSDFVTLILQLIVTVWTGKHCCILMWEKPSPERIPEVWSHAPRLPQIETENHEARRDIEAYEEICWYGRKGHPGHQQNKLLRLHDFISIWLQ